MRSALHLTLLTRTYCHLCHDMERQVREKMPVMWTLNMIDVDQHPQLQDKYDADVPVLLAGDVEVFHHVFDDARWQRFLAQTLA